MKRGLFVKFTALSLLICVIFSVALSAAAIPVTGAVDLVGEQQVLSNWCWAAASVCILRYFGKYATQIELAQYLYGGAYNYPASDQQVKTVLQYKGVLSTYVADSISFSMIRSEIYTYERPIYAGISWTGTGSGHAVVISGYDQSITPKMVEYMDPATGSHYTSSYDTFVGSTSSGWLWDATLRFS